MTHERVYTTLDKSSWGPGPWSDEPDKVQWKDETTGLPCLAVRNGRGGGNWCGYVGVDATHPLYEKHYDTAHDLAGGYGGDPGTGISVHGGLTYADHCAHSTDESQGICHVPDPGEPDDVWWFGFDCAHSMDFTPGIASRYRDWPAIPGEIYRTLGYVREEVRRLARDLARVAA